MKAGRHYSKDLVVAIEAAYRAGKVALQHPQRGVNTPPSPEGSWQKIADNDVEQVVVNFLSQARPEYGVLGEELGTHGPQDARWLIDPIDGTKYYVRNIPKWTVHIALEVESDIVIGVCYNPVTEDLLYAVRGEGAYYNHAPARVSKRSMTDALMLYTSIESLIRLGYKEAFFRMLEGGAMVNSFGSYEGFLSVVRGHAEVSLKGRGAPFDIAVQKIVTEEAGGRFSDLTGKDTIYSHSFILSNGVFHDEVVRLLNES